jgi:aminoglycoside 6'-N-acetyltransferase
VLATYLIDDFGHHRLTIDPAAANTAANTAAIHCYTKVGFRPVGLMRRYERGSDDTRHDGLLMDLLATELNRGLLTRMPGAGAGPAGAQVGLAPPRPQADRP